MMTQRIANMTFHPAKLRGFTLVEMMVALVAGLIVSGAAVAFMISSMKSNSDYLSGARLGQELRNSMDYVNRELRRAGYDENALNYVALPTGSTSRSVFGTILIANDGADDSCILYSYDKAANNHGVIDASAGERHGIRRVVRAITTANGVQNIGVIEIADSDATATAPACNGASPDYSVYPPACVSGAAGDGWCALSDPKLLNVTQFRITAANLDLNPSGGNFGSQMRELGLIISGSPIRDPTFVQSLSSSIKVRADCLHSTSGTSQCTVAP